MIKEDYLLKGVSILLIFLSLPAVVLIPVIFSKYMFSLDFSLENTFLALWSEVWLHAHAGQPPIIANHALCFDIAGCLFLIFSDISFLRNVLTGKAHANINNKLTWKDFPSFLLEEPSFFTYRFAIVTFLTFCSIIINEIFWPSLNFLDQWFLALVLLFGDKYCKPMIMRFLRNHL